jgi:ferredoxin
MVRPMPNVTFVNWGRTVRTGPLANVRTVAKLAGISLYNGLAAMANCRGAGLCGTCRVVIEPADAVTPPTRREKVRGCTGPFRLACQARVRSDRKDLRVTKRTGLYGTGTTPVEGPGLPAASARPLAARTGASPA